MRKSIATNLTRAAQHITAASTEQAAVTILGRIVAAQLALNAALSDAALDVALADGEAEHRREP